MQAFEYLVEYPFARQALFMGLIVATLCSLISVVVVLKRMAFVGHGVSHAAFGGVGLAVFLNLGAWWHSGIVLAFALLTAFVIGGLSRRRKVEQDSAVGIVLVAGMALGVLLVNLRSVYGRSAWYADLFGAPQPVPGFDTVLFGSLLSVTPGRLWLAAAVCVVVLTVAAALYKEIVFYTFDEGVSRVFGVPATAIHYLIMAGLAITIVLAMQLVGVVLLMALLVIPGATAVLISRRLGAVLLWSWVVGMAGMAGGLLLSFEVERLFPGACVALVLAGIFGGVYVWRAVAARRRGACG